MATAYAKYTGRLGCCLATSGPGAIHLLNGLYDAKLDQNPVLAITGSTYHDLIGTHYQQDIDEKVLYQGVAAYNERIMGPSHVRAVADLACRTALNDKCVSHLNFPTDMQHWQMPGHPSSARVLGATSQTFAFGAQLPAAGELDRAAAALDKGKRICILAGRGALGCQDELEALAEKLGAPIVKALMGKAAVPDESPYTTGGIGSARHQTFRRGDAKLRYPAHRGQQLPLYELLSSARHGGRDSDRPQPGAHRAALSGRRRPDRR